MPLAPLQATRNGNDLWLSHWVSHATPTNQTSEPHPYLWCAGGMPSMPGVPPPTCVPSSVRPAAGSGGGASLPASGTPMHSGGSSLGGSPPASSGLGSSSLDSSPGSSSSSSSCLDPQVRYYLTVLLAIAAANSAITLARAFSFAKGGLVAAKVGGD